MTKQTAYANGFMAFSNCAPLQANPFSPGWQSELWNAWRNGWLDNKYNSPNFPN